MTPEQIKALRTAIVESGLMIEPVRVRLAAEAFGLSAGQKVRVLAPFDKAFPDVQVVESFTEDAVQIEGGTQFAPKFLEAV